MARPSAISICLLGLEFVLTISTVIFFGLAYPDRFRSRLWENGGEKGWNSNPNKRIYFYANHLEPPEIPLIWSQRLTDSNLAVAILSLVIFLARAIMVHLDYLPKYANVLYDILLASFWIFSLHGQTSEDYSDPEHPSTYPWYLTHSCSDSWAVNRGYCRLAQASFVFSIFSTTLYVGRLVMEALLAAYRRGRDHGRGWTALGTEKDLDVEEEGMLTAVADRYDPGLSPVLAFFPSEPDHPKG